MPTDPDRADGRPDEAAAADRSARETVRIDPTGHETRRLSVRRAMPAARSTPDNRETVRLDDPSRPGASNRADSPSRAASDGPSRAASDGPSRAGSDGSGNGPGSGSERSAPGVLRAAGPGRPHDAGRSRHRDGPGEPG